MFRRGQCRGWDHGGLWVDCVDDGGECGAGGDEKDVSAVRREALADAQQQLGVVFIVYEAAHCHVPMAQEEVQPLLPM